MQQAEGALAGYTAARVELDRARALSENLLGLLVGQPGLKVAPGDLRSLPAFREGRFLVQDAAAGGLAPGWVTLAVRG